jgi:hypothetical protein
MFHRQWRSDRGTLGAEKSVDGIWRRIGRSQGVHRAFYLSSWTAEQHGCRPLPPEGSHSNEKGWLAQGSDPSLWQWPYSHTARYSSYSNSWNNVTLTGSNDGTLHSALLFLWTWSIVQYSKNEATKFRELPLFPSSGGNSYPVGYDPWTGIGINPFYQTQQSSNFHLTTEAELAPET